MGLYFEGTVKRKEMMLMKGKEVGFIDFLVSWHIDDLYTGDTLKIKIDVYTKVYDDIQVDELYRVEAKLLGTLLKAVNISKMK